MQPDPISHLFFFLEKLSSNICKLNSFVGIYCGWTDGNIGDKFAMQTTGNGKVYVAQPLDWEQQSSYLLNISITDGHNIIYTQVSIFLFVH